MKIRTITSLIFVILLVQTVIGIGLSPANTNIAFEPNLTREYSLTVYNTDHKSFEASLELEGELKQFLLLKSGTAIFKPEDNQKRISFNVSFPRDIPPGTYNSILRITEKPIGEKNTITTVLSITHLITLSVPTHGKYIKESIVEKNDTIYISVKNIGLKKIGNFSVNSNIYDEEKSYSQQESKNNFLSDEILNLTIKLNQTPGRYTHNILINYDELFKNISRTITIGSIEITILNLEMNNSITGRIIPIDLFLTSNWNQELEIFAEIDFFDETGKIDTIKSPNLNIRGDNSTKLFWNSEKLTEGDYKLVAKVFYKDNIISEKEFDIKLTKEKVEVKEETKISEMITIILIITIISLASLIITLNKKKVRRKK